MTACQVWPQSLLWQFLCFPLRSSSMSLFPETLMTLLQNLLFQPDFLFSSTCSLSFFTFSSSLHRFRFSFKTIHLPRLYEFWKEVRKQSFNDFFQKLFKFSKTVQESPYIFHPGSQYVNISRNWSIIFKIRKLFIISQYCLIYRLFFSNIYIILLSISGSRSNPSSSMTNKNTNKKPKGSGNHFMHPSP